MSKVYGLNGINIQWRARGGIVESTFYHNYVHTYFVVLGRAAKGPSSVPWRPALGCYIVGPYIA